jgi:hypothetical protein
MVGMQRFIDQKTCCCPTAPHVPTCTCVHQHPHHRHTHVMIVEQNEFYVNDALGGDLTVGWELLAGAKLPGASGGPSMRWNPLDSMCVTHWDWQIHASLPHVFHHTHTRRLDDLHSPGRRPPPPPAPPRRVRGRAPLKSKSHVIRHTSHWVCEPTLFISSPRFLHQNGGGVYKFYASDLCANDHQVLHHHGRKPGVPAPNCRF